MIIVVADTSGIIAAVDYEHEDHLGAAETLNSAGLIVMSPLLLAEIDHVVTRELGRDVAISIVDDIRGWMRKGRLVVPEIEERHLASAQSLRARYRDLNLDLADAVNVAFAADYETDAVLTLDRRDFRVIRPLGAHKAFRLLPDDLPL